MRIALSLFFLCAAGLPGWQRSNSDAPRPPLFFREDWKETPEHLPVTQEHVANPNLLMSLYGPGKAGVKKSHHAKPADDPYYIWNGNCEANCAITLKHKSDAVDLSGMAHIRWRSKQSGFHQTRLILKLGDGSWIVSDKSDGESSDWHEFDFVIGDIRWRKLDIAKVVEGAWVDKPDLTRVQEIGWTDLAPGNSSAACSRIDWIEVYGAARKLTAGK